MTQKITDHFKYTFKMYYYLFLKLINKMMDFLHLTL